MFIMIVFSVTVLTYMYGEAPSLNLRCQTTINDLYLCLHYSSGNYIDLQFLLRIFGARSSIRTYNMHMICIYGRSFTRGQFISYQIISYRSRASAPERYAGRTCAVRGDLSAILFFSTSLAQVDAQPWRTVTLTVFC